MTESLYDLLGVEPSATEAQIKSAWRSLVTVLGPTDHRFASINEAASVLLDADKRSTYDATLAVEETPAAPVSPLTPPAAERAADPVVVSNEDDAQGEESELVEADAAAPEAAHSSGESDTDLGPAASAPTVSAPPGWAAPLAAPWVVTVAAAVALALVIATSLSYLLKDDGPPVSERTIAVNLTDSSVKPIKQQVTTRETPDVTAALAAAVAAAPRILNFDYRDVDSWNKVATPYMTADFIKTYMPYFDGMVKPNIKRVHGAVTLRPVLDAGVVSTEPGVVQVLIIVDAETSTTNQTVIAQEFAILKMAKVNGRWLVDKFGTAPIPK